MWLKASEALVRLGSKPQSLYASVSRGPHPRQTRSRSIADAASISEEDVDRLAARARGRRSSTTVATEAINWGDPVLASAISTIQNGRLYYRGIDVVQLSADRHAGRRSGTALGWGVAHAGCRIGANGSIDRRGVQRARPSRSDRRAKRGAWSVGPAHRSRGDTFRHRRCAAGRHVRSAAPAACRWSWPAGSGGHPAPDARAARRSRTQYLDLRRTGRCVDRVIPRRRGARRPRCAGWPAAWQRRFCGSRHGRGCRAQFHGSDGFSARLARRGQGRARLRSSSLPTRRHSRRSAAGRRGRTAGVRPPANGRRGVAWRSPERRFRHGRHCRGIPVAATGSSHHFRSGAQRRVARAYAGAGGFRAADPAAGTLHRCSNWRAGPVDLMYADHNSSSRGAHPRHLE